MTTARQVDPAAAAELFIIQDQIHEPMHDRFLWATMQRRHAEAAAIPEWEELREIASKIKEHTLTHLDHYLEEFEANDALPSTAGNQGYRVGFGGANPTIGRAATEPHRVPLDSQDATGRGPFVRPHHWHRSEQ